MYNDEQTLIRDTARAFAQDILAPGAAARDRAKTVDPSVFSDMAELGFLGMTVPEEWDGVGADYVSYALALMEIAAADGAISTIMSVHNAPFNAILTRFGSDFQKEQVLRPAAKGEFIGAFALTEANAGSDAAAIRTRAEKRGNRYVINGGKEFITSGRIGGWCILFATLDGTRKGITAFLTPTSVPGYEAAKVEEKLGQRCSDTCSLRFTDLEIPEEYRIGEEGQGYRIALSSLEAGRIGIASQSVGMAQAAFDAAVAYARERTSMGKRLIEHQAVAFRLAELRTKLEAARQLVLLAARMKDAGLPCLNEAAMAKLFASETAEVVVSGALQTFGGYGYMQDFALERIYRDVRVCQIYEGTSDIQKIIISRQLDQ
ncbi:acyl-CoA dehydrogenase [Haematobacter missouriensis]|uniref:Acyl-CoA dehydrogenase n=1 Tax=Haematobacter missouriensis TaxID=366616 RepID=A0ABX3ZUI3_9RHOB|nr:acyl-CoA dehydrogenase family protein [Haematobacter missouriensis]KFI32578.1 acyl-CoA dehydrogenase [Haematobacter missouriensis]OWJ76753.1 acyl-CoA dehydrogenase [Haematobacter missouriensis]